jgi:hypothetical protein
VLQVRASWLLANLKIPWGIIDYTIRIFIVTLLAPALRFQNTEEALHIRSCLAQQQVV